MGEGWEEQGARSFTAALRPKTFVSEHIAPLLAQRTRPPEKDRKEDPPLQKVTEFLNEKEFWQKAGSLTFHSVRLNRFRLSDWFPRTPGVYWSGRGIRSREKSYTHATTVDPRLGRIFAPESKMCLIEDGGIGTIRLRPRRLDGTDCWFATAVKGPQCAGGIPLLVPHTFIHQGAIEWGDTVSVVGTVRFLQDAKLDEVAAYVHHASPMIIFVEEIDGHSSRQRSEDDITITPVALFDRALSSDTDSEDQYWRGSIYGCTFVQSGSDDRALDDAADWIELYAQKHGGKVLTNFDERSPMLADAPLSYQRLVNKTYDRTIITNFHLEKLADRIDSVTTEYTNYGQVAAMGEGARSDRNIFRRGKDIEDNKNR